TMDQEFPLNLLPRPRQVEQTLQEPRQGKLVERSGDLWPVPTRSKVAVVQPQRLGGDSLRATTSSSAADHHPFLDSSQELFPRKSLEIVLNTCLYAMIRSIRLQVGK